MVIEFLSFRIPPDRQASFLVKDKEVWTGFLRTVPGFIRKEVWRSPEQPDLVQVVIWWETKQAWQSVTESEIQQVDQRMGEDLYVPETAEYQVLTSRD